MTERTLGRWFFRSSLWVGAFCLTQLEAPFVFAEQATDPSAELLPESAAPAVPAPPTLDMNGLVPSGTTRTELKRGIILDSSQDGQAQPRFTSKLPIGARGALIFVENVEVQSGLVEAEAPRDASAGVLLQGPSGVQAITASGRLSMKVSADHVAVAAWESQALVGKNGAFKVLPPNTVRTFDLASGQTLDRPRLQAPSVRSAGLGFSLGGEVPVLLEAKSPEPAAKYCGSLFDALGKIVAHSCNHKSAKRIMLMAPRAGNYWGAVAAVDTDGFKGAVSPPALVRVLGLARPYEVKNGAVLLGPGEDAELVGYEGLIMRYGTSPEYFPASASVAMFERKPTSIEFRNPAQPTEYAILNLSPRLLKSRIQIGPALGTWPENEVKISVQMWDGDGNALESLDDYRILTRVGLEPVEVEFAQRGSKLVGTLSPQGGPGPWVVRVSILDSAGNEVSRDFLEMARSEAEDPNLAIAGLARETRVKTETKTAHR